MTKPKTAMETKPLTAELDSLITQGAYDRLVDFLLARTDAERAALAKPAMTRLRNSSWRRLANGGVSAGDGGEYKPQVWEAARLAVLATNPFSTLVRFRWGNDGGFSRWTPWRQQMYRLVSGLRPVWLDDWAEAILKQSLDNWAFVRRLICDGLCRKPMCDEYTLGMLREIRWRFASDEPDGKGNLKERLKNVQAALLNDTGLFKEDLWKIFEIEGNSECNLQSLEPVGRTSLAKEYRSISDPAIHSWRYALVALAKAGHLPRARLLEASLAALARGFTPHRAVWFAHLHDDLQPTLDERQKHLQAYLGLLGSPNPSAAVFALEVLLALDKEKAIRGTEVLTRIEPVLELKAKASVKSALQWLARIVRREPKLAGQTVLAATTALYHAAPDIQAAAFTFIENQGDRADAKLRQRLEECRQAVAATLKPRLEAWLKTPATASDRPVPVKTPAAPKAKSVDTPPKRAVSRLAPALAIQPIATFDELLDRAAFVLANSAAVDEAERVLDGLLRLGASRPADFDHRVAPLLKLALKPFPRSERFGLEQVVEFDYERIFRWMQDGVAGLMALLLVSWARRKPLLRVGDASKSIELNSHFTLHYHRLAALTGLLLEDVRLPLLSAPTHQGGWIDPVALVERLKAWRRQDRPVELHDFALALLRLAPENREAALPSAAKLGGETGDALSYALGAESIKIGATPAFWIAAARTRNPFLDDLAVEHRHPGLGPDAGLAVRFLWQTETVTEHYRNPFEKAISEMVKLKPRPESAFTVDRLTIAYGPAVPKHLETPLVTVMLHSGFDADGFDYKQAASLLRWTFTFWPASREPLFATLAQWLMDETNGFEYRQGYRHPVMLAAFEVMADPHTWIGPMAALLLTLALLSPDAECRGLGVDALLASVDDGRFNAGIVGGSISKFLPTTLCKCVRLVQSLSEVARVSPRHALALGAIIEQAMRGNPAKAPRDLGKLLGLWRELQAGHGLLVTIPEAREYLAGLQSGQAAKLAKQLLAATS